MTECEEEGPKPGDYLAELIAHNEGAVRSFAEVFGSFADMDTAQIDVGVNGEFVLSAKMQDGKPNAPVWLGLKHTLGNIPGSGILLQVGQKPFKMRDRAMFEIFVGDGQYPMINQYETLFAGSWLGEGYRAMGDILETLTAICDSSQPATDQA